MSPGAILKAAAGQHKFRVMLAFSLVYLFWGSTYLAMRVAVRQIPPYAVGGARYMIAGPLMLAVLALSGRKIRLDLHDFARLLTLGVLLLSISNIAVLWAEEYVPSGLTALIVALVPIFVVALEAWVFRVGRMPVRGLCGLALGLIGVLVLLWPKIVSGSHLSRLELMGAGILACGSLVWSFGSILSHRWTLTVDVFVAAAWQMTLAGAVNSVIALVTGQFFRAHWTLQGMGTILYLVVAGSWLGFTAYIWLLEHVLPPKVATYAYVNPIVALFLGWLILNEHIDGYMLAGTAVIIGAVALVNTTKLHRAGATAALAEEAPAASVAGD
ncbi:MAG TPA: EamA family transporter [Candidatus Angelobacter sp.]|nr:EamA family transporter [Candidatus Angelobacter sp.]